VAEETAAEALESLAQCINHAAATCALRAGLARRRVLWPWQGEDEMQLRHMREMEASPERVALCRSEAQRVVQLLTREAPL
jgi:hypothetical protein